MYSPFLNSLISPKGLTFHKSLTFVAPVILMFLLNGCEREKRDFPNAADTQPDQTITRLSPLQPAVEKAQQGSGHSVTQPADYYKKYEQNAFAVSQGKRLYRWYNCLGCHSAGGGNMGPPLMDSKWRYGAEPAQIFATIKEGRPNGMPSFSEHIPDDQIWQIVAYVRSMSGQLRIDVAPNREDKIQAHEPESRRKQEPIEGEPLSGDPKQ